MAKMRGSSFCSMGRRLTRKRCCRTAGCNLDYFQGLSVVEFVSSNFVLRIYSLAFNSGSPECFYRIAVKDFIHFYSPLSISLDKPAFI